MERNPKHEQPFYTNLRDGDVLTVCGEIPLRIVYVEKAQGGRGMVGLAVDPPESLEVRFDAATKTLTRVAGLPRLQGTS